MPQNIVENNQVVEFNQKRMAGRLPTLLSQGVCKACPKLYLPEEPQRNNKEKYNSLK
jgi:hypothetical protein